MRQPFHLGRHTVDEYTALQFQRQRESHLRGELHGAFEIGPILETSYLLQIIFLMDLLWIGWCRIESIMLDIRWKKLSAERNTS